MLVKQILSVWAVMSAIEGHIIGEGRVTGIFERERQEGSPRAF